MIGVPYVDVSGTANDDAAIAAAIASGAMITTSRPLTLRQPVDLRRAPNPRFSLIGTGPCAMPINTGAISNSSVFYYRAPAGNPGLTGFSFEGLDVYGNGSVNQTLIDIAGDGANAGEINYLRFRSSRVWSVSGVLHVANLANANVSDIVTMGCDYPIWLQNAGQAVLSDLRLEQGKGDAIAISGTDPTNVHTEEGVMLSNINVACFDGIGLKIANHGWGEVSAYEFTSCNAGGLMASTVTNWRFGVGVFGGCPSSPAALINGGSTLLSFVGSSFQVSGFGLVLDGGEHGITGCQFNNNTNVDLMMQGVRSSCITGNRLLSAGVPWSVVEDAQCAGNRYVGNLVRSAAVLQSSSSSV